MSHPIYNDEIPNEDLQHIVIKTLKGRKIGLAIGSLGGIYWLLDWQPESVTPKTPTPTRQNLSLKA